MTDNHKDYNDDAQQTDPAASDVLAQQMGTEYTEVTPQDREELQNELKDQAPAPDGELETEVPSEGAVDDRNTSDGQVIGT